MVATARKWMSVTLVATLFIGVGAGILVDRFLLGPTAFGADVERRSGRGGDHRDHGRHMVERLEERLDLNSDQVVQLEAVVNRHHETARAFWKDSRSQFETLRVQIRHDIRELLTEEQKVEFDTMVAEYESKREHRRER